MLPLYETQQSHFLLNTKVRQSHAAQGHGQAAQGHSQAAQGHGQAAGGHTVFTAANAVSIPVLSALAFTTIPFICVRECVSV